MAMQTNSDRSLKTQTSILQAATRLTKINGWESTKIRDICAEAGVSVGAFYHHFPSKQVLMQQAFLLFDTTLNENLPGGTASPIQSIKEVLLAQTAFIVAEAGSLITEYYKNILSDEHRSAVNPERKYYQRVLMHVREAEGAFKEGYKPEYIAELLIKFVRGCIIDWCLHDYKYDVVKSTGAELDLLLEALIIK